jgi:predicted nucleic acid-binding protein
MKPVVLDASALLAMFYGEPGADEVRALFHRANAADQPLLMTAVNWAETLYRIEKRQGSTGVSAARQLAASGPLSIIPSDEEQAELAAGYKAAGLLALADCFAAALTTLRKAELVTADYDFKAVEKELKITWLKKA